MKENFSKKDTNIIKGIAILFLMFHHCFLSGDRYINLQVVFSPFSESIVNYIAAFLKICVPIFVFLTAYGITISLKKQYQLSKLKYDNISEYVKHRFFNLYIGWIFVFLFCEIFGLIYNRLPIEIYGKNIQGVIYFCLDGLGIANLFGTPTLVGTWWYMSLAVTLILIIPLAIKIYEKIGFVYMFVLFSILSRQLAVTDSSIIHWLPVVFLGIVSADKKWLVKIANYEVIKKSNILNKTVKLLVGIILILASIKFRQSGVSAILFEIKDGVIPFIVICFCYEFINPIKYLNTALGFIGKHSMNIFLIHTFIRATYFRKFIYSFKYPPVIIIVLLAISLMVSMIVELMKKYLGYNKMTDKIREKVDKHK